jgi:hypothetical protein
MFQLTRPGPPGQPAGRRSWSARRFRLAFDFHKQVGRWLASIGLRCRVDYDSHHAEDTIPPQDVTPDRLAGPPPLRALPPQARTLDGDRGRAVDEPPVTAR